MFVFLATATGAGVIAADNERACGLDFLGPKFLIGYLLLDIVILVFQSVAFPVLLCNPLLNMLL